MPKLRPGPPPKEAAEFFEEKGLKVGFDYRDVWKEEHNYAFTIAKVVERDVLNDVKGLLERALVEGLTFKEFQANVKPMLDRSGWTNYNTATPEVQRLKTIYQTNTRMARGVGQWQRIERTKKTLPYLVYKLGPSRVHRPEHVALEGTTLPVEDPFWDYAMPPNGYGCRCHVIQITKRRAEAQGVSETPDPDLREWTNTRTGNVELVPNHVQPGFNFNPGKYRKRALDNLAKGVV